MDQPTSLTAFLVDAVNPLRVRRRVKELHRTMQAVQDELTQLADLFPAVVNGSRPTYLPPREAYGKGLYQESVAILAPGSLEQLIQTVGEQLHA